ncbi:MAG: two-component sensor histidine kinase [Gammaproteobacteria bacterium]|nr:two-component sensor histidine kinase [Gammaproteobacteria bacterium]
MEGFKKRLSESVQLKLSYSLSLAILLIAVVASIFSFVSAFKEANELQDDMLRQVATLVNQQHLAPTGKEDIQRIINGPEDSRMIVQYLSDSTNVHYSEMDKNPTILPISLTDGMHTVDINGDPFRVFIRTTSGQRIAVAQETDMRDAIARDSALRTLMPFLILVPILLLIVSDLIKKMFQPIVALSTEIDLRAEQNLHPIEQNHLPSEVRPFVVAINRLLIRIEQSMEIQRRFVADAAHELRSPLTALSLQAERLAKVDMPEIASERLVMLCQGIERSRSLVHQLLSLANAQTTVFRPQSLVSIQYIYRCVLEDIMPQAEDKHIDIGVEGELDVQVWANELDLITIVKNLVDNAIRYTPNGGKVDLSVSIDGIYAQLIIKDTGTGIAISERDRVFDPFYRTIGSEGVGSGLGLSIVKAVTDRIGAQIKLGWTDEDRLVGLSVSVLLLLPSFFQE